MSEILKGTSITIDQFVSGALELSLADLWKLEKYFIYRKQLLTLIRHLKNCNVEGELYPTINKCKEMHLSDCIWSNDDSFEGPDTCYCHEALDNPESFLAKYGIGNQVEKWKKNIKVFEKRRKENPIVNYRKMDILKIVRESESQKM